MQPSGAFQHNAEERAILPTGCAQKTARYSLYMLLRVQFFNKHHAIQLPNNLLQYSNMYYLTFLISKVLSFLNSLLSNENNRSTAAEVD